jgi:hypothetical protein
MRKNMTIVKRPRHRQSRAQRSSIKQRTRKHSRRAIINKGSITLFDVVLNPVECMLVFVIIIMVIVSLITGCNTEGFTNNNVNNEDNISFFKKIKNFFKNLFSKNNNNNDNNNNNNNDNNTLLNNSIKKSNNKSVKNIKTTTQSKTQHNTKRSNTNSKLEKDENDNGNGNGNTIKIQVESSCEPKQEKNLSYFQYQDLKAHERIINPLLPPERSMEGSYGIPINVPTRGEVGSFQQIGALYKETVESEDMTPGNNTDSVVLALFGKQTYPRSQKWTYYTSSDRNHQVKMPLSNKGKKCDSQYGCEEISNDDLITVPGYNGVFRAVIYDYDAPKYIPCV